MWQLAIIKQQPANDTPLVIGHLIWVKVGAPRLNWPAKCRDTNATILIERAVVVNLDPEPDYTDIVWHLDNLELLGIFRPKVDLLQYEEWLTEAGQQPLRRLLKEDRYEFKKV